MGEQREDLMSSMNSIDNNNNQSKNNQKKEVNTWLGIGIIILIAIILGGGIYFFCIKDNSEKDDSSKPTSTPTVTAEPVIKDEVLQVTDSAVQTLFGYIKDSSIQTKFYDGKVTKLAKNDLSNEEKNTMGVLFVTTGEMSNSNCNNYPNNISYNQDQTINNMNYICGAYQDVIKLNVCSGTEEIINKKYDDRNNQTLTFSSDKLKEKVETIFGNNTYQPTTFRTKTLQDKYNYDANSKQYIHMALVSCGGTSGPKPTSSLVSALKNANNIQIVESIVASKNEGQEFDLNIKIRHVFKNENGNYYYDYSEKIN